MTDQSSKCQQAKIFLDQIKDTTNKLIESSSIQYLTSGDNRVKVWDLEQITKVAIERLRGLFIVSIAEAREILNDRNVDNVIGPEILKRILEVELLPEEIPPIPFTRKELATAHKLNQALMLLIEKDSDDNNLTIEQLQRSLSEKFPDIEQDKELFFDDVTGFDDREGIRINDDDRNKGYKASWVLITKNLIPNSRGLNFLQQTVLLKEYLRTKVLPPLSLTETLQYQIAIDELNQQITQLQSQIPNDLTTMMAMSSSERETRARQLTQLKINQLFRPDLVTTYYFVSFYFAQNNQLPFSSFFHLTNSLRIVLDEMTRPIVDIKFQAGQSIVVNALNPGGPGDRWTGTLFYRRK